MKSFIRHNIIYILLYIGILCFAGYVLFYQGKVQIHKSMNAFVGNEWLDSFFKYITHLGDGVFAFVVIFMFLFFNIRKSVYIFLSYGTASLVSSVLKHLIYPDISRPHFVFQYFVREELNEVDGVELSAFHSFPSGHALSAFALFFCLLFVSRSHFLKIVFFSLAVLSAYSRVYLSQHWLIDIYVGSIIGFVFSLIFYRIFYHTDKWQKLNTTLPLILSQNTTKRV